MTASIYDFSVTNIQGQTVPLAEYKDRVVLIVNTASKCGFTPQYKELEQLYQKYQAQGLVILGFPCNQFGAQEQGDNETISQFCELNFGVSFPLFEKVEVNGPNTLPLYRYLKTSAKGLLGSEKVKWNFTKFLVNRQGEAVTRFAPTTKPMAIEADILKLL
ncbi:glutathione peroxidase [Shewanella fidelis]|uniref:Glutathione peroxidase n=1 Tax=Shewanella fidelis TaxID=173509 RepID=A0AAW8NJF6_9GAMM|nr:glutathione peroxidase [Shewanella fidelis]MDR8522997.1 glutathione peroxidase [Shewanella fidelis]MDW4811677.1 glutathione peroxidase [Shewanella fidelis]MDW4815798.1 glutathione peroxidase [Shewanella fidelis]MDW4819888.1 glutathione peroxidase [Shewanella fidelis]MDW4824138.1 glutathione peroxidase [Shewanella fidelis]